MLRWHHPLRAGSARRLSATSVLAAVLAGIAGLDLALPGPYTCMPVLAGERLHDDAALLLVQLEHPAVSVRLSDQASPTTSNGERS